MERRGRRNSPARLTYRQPCRRHPIFPVSGNQTGRHSSVTRQTGADGDEAAFAIMSRHVPETVWRIGKSMEHHYDTDRLAVRLHDIGAVPIVSAIFWVDRTRLEVAINRHALAGREFLAHLGTNAGHNLVLFCEVVGPVRR